ncbi:MAG: hypothetical protein JWP43_2963 [Ramlibacter sp.]|nr:hypothetical protein [Ramlibacter sp.]
MEMKIAQKMVLAALAMSGAAYAQTPAPAGAPAAQPDYTLSYNVGVVSDYRYRGISQSRLKPALQGGIDFAHKSGFYLGTWGSTIKWIKDAGATKGSFELDLYGGYKGEIAKDFTYDVGYLRYQYVNNKLGNVPGLVNANTDELYGALTYGMFTAKYSHSLSNLFGNPNSKGSGYLDLSANVDMGNGWSIVPHIGHQKVRHLSVASYTDYSLTVGKDMGSGFSLSAAVVGTDAERSFYFTPAGKFAGRTGLVVGAKYSF